MGIKTNGWGLKSREGDLEPMSFERREPTSEDLFVETLYCGICHTDLGVGRERLAPGNFPMVPGHEIVGRVISAGEDTEGFAPGDLVGIGCIVDSCLHCPPCEAHEEQFCDNGFTLSFNARDSHGDKTYGGYSDNYVVKAHYAVKIPASLDPARAAPLLCGGITVYTPLRRYKAGPGKKVGVLGLGGLGHMAVKFAKAMGAEVTMLTSSAGKAEDAAKLGADHVIVTTDSDAVAAAAGSLDLIINTIANPHDPNPYIFMLARRGMMCLVGAPDQPLSLMSAALLTGDRELSGSLIGGIAATQEMLDFAGEHGVQADVEIVPLSGVNEAWRRLEANDVRYRFVIDLKAEG